jgi:hypothetical protein
MRPRLLLCTFAFLGLTAACGGDDEEAHPCDPALQRGCGEGQVCEEVEGGEPACFHPVEVRGRVFDSTTEEGIEGATVVALDANQVARSSAVLSDEDGRYALAVAVRRRADGTPVDDAPALRATLCAAAQGYQPFPQAPRTALPIDLRMHQVDEKGVRYVANAATDVALLALEDASAATGTITGFVQGATMDMPLGGVLVLAVHDGKAVSSAISASDGSFVLFNVPAGEVRVEAYRGGYAISQPWPA